MKDMSLSLRKIVLLLSIGAVLLPLRAMAQYIPATAAFDNSPVCSDSDLSSNTDLARGNPEWKPVKGLTIDPNHPSVSDRPFILEGRVPHPPGSEVPTNQAPAEVSEEEIPWNHYTHDFTFKVVPDLAYQYLLSSWVDASGSVDHHHEMEVEWENASAMNVHDDDDRKWGGLPEFAWPSVGDRVWVAGRWVFDCGHPSSSDKAHVQFSTEIHPPRAVVAIRPEHPALSSLGSVFSQSWLPVTGSPVLNIYGNPSSDPTHVPVTEADIFISGNGGGANDLCMLEGTTSDNDCQHGHTNPVIPVNDMNYVFDVYPPGTDYDRLLVSNHTFVVTPPVPDASLQWRVVDQSGQIPAHACGGTDTSSCVPLPDDHVLFCLVDALTPPPDQTETDCPTTLLGRPNRLRVILKFLNTDANVFAKSILLGWDDVPAPPTTPAVRTFRISLHEYDVIANDEFGDGDWRVFVDVGGQWRYMSALFDRNGDGNSACNGADPLTESSNGDCYWFDNSPWIVSVRDGEPIHVAVGGFDSDDVDSDFCGATGNRDKYPNGCNPFNVGDRVKLGAFNDDRLGTYEFDLKPEDAYAAPAPFPIVKTSDSSFCLKLLIIATCDFIIYEVEFRVREITSPAVDPSFPLNIGDPHFGNYVNSATPLILTAAHGDYQGFQYRFKPWSGPLPTYPSNLPFPVHWTSVDLPGTTRSVSVYNNFGNTPDGQYDLQYSAETSGFQLEPRHTATVILDNTPPVTTFTQPQATTYTHSDTLTLSYVVSDGFGSGLASFTPTMDDLTAIPGVPNLQSGTPINLLTTLKLGSHTFKVASTDNIGNSGANSVTFTIVVTPESIEQDVTQFLQLGAIKNAGLASTLMSNLVAAAAARARGNCNTASNNYTAFINTILTQRGKGITIFAADTMIADAQYLIAHCP